MNTNSEPKTDRRSGQGLHAVRLSMVLGSMAPLFLLWVVRGSAVVPDHVLIPIGALAIALPHLVVVLRMLVAERRRDRHALSIESSEDHRGDVLVYLFAMLLPFYAMPTESWRDVAALLGAVGFIAFLYLHLNLNYMNIFLAIAGYNVFTIRAAQVDSGFSDVRTRVLVTKKQVLPPGELVAVRLSDTVYWERG